MSGRETLRTDSFFRALNVVDVEHCAIHSKIHYTLHDDDLDVDIASPKYYRLQSDSTADEEVHMIMAVYADAAVFVEFFEDDDSVMNIIAVGTPLVERNNYR